MFLQPSVVIRRFEIELDEFIVEPSKPTRHDGCEVRTLKIGRASSKSSVARFHAALALMTVCSVVRRSATAATP